MTFFRKLAAGLAVLALGACAAMQGSAPSTPAAEASRPQIFVAAANPIAAEAGMAVLRRGGSAADAALAVQAMLSLVEPQSSGVGGGAFMTWYEGRTRKVTVYDGREVAPAGADETLFLGPDGKALPFGTAVLSGRSTGVPGAVGMLALVHREHGHLKWNSLFVDAERTARAGFTVSPRLGRMIAGNFPENSAPDVRAYFSNADGSLKKPGDRLLNPQYAEFLVRLAAEGPDALYKGPTAERIVARLRQGDYASSMTLADLAAYKPVKREPLCGRYRVYLVCTPPPPASGVGLLQLLMILERTDIATRGPGDPQAWFLFGEASRIMYADRDRYVGDPAFVQVPVKGMLDPAYVDGRAKLIGETAAATPPVAGNPPGAPMAALDTTYEPMGTSHFVIGDADGNVVSMTTTVESIFGSGRMVDGFFLNNQMTDFAMQPRDGDGRLLPNAPAAGKRPRSSMTPLVFLDADGRFVGAAGSAGGNAILAYVGKTMVATIDWGLPMQDAIALPNLVARGGVFNGEVTKFSPEILQALALRGMRIVPGQGEDSGLQGVMFRRGMFDGGYDPRREGRAVAEAAPGRRR